MILIDQFTLIQKKTLRQRRCKMKIKHNVICKVGHGNFKRHTLVLSDNVTAFVEQLESNSVSTGYYRVTFKPSVIIPDIDKR